MKAFRAFFLTVFPVLFLALLFQSCGSNNNNPSNPAPQPTNTATYTFTIGSTTTATETTSSTPTNSPTHTTTGTPTFTATNTLTATPSSTPAGTATSTHTPTVTPTFTATGTSTSSFTVTATDSATTTPTVTPTFTSTGTPTHTFTVTATYTITNSPTITPTPNRTVCATKTPFGDPNNASVGGGTGLPAPLFIYSIFTYSGASSATLWDIQLYMFTGGSSAGAVTLQCAVYDQVTGNAIGLSAVTVVNTNSAAEWVTFPVTPQTILPGRNYILAFNLIGTNAAYLPLFSADTTTANNFYTDNSITTTPGNYTGNGTQYANTLNIFADICP